VAVVQISKIQIRRGLKSTGVPQLSSAELAWAVDTQELYIGNGSVAEGAPYVGNTKVITEHDNILELASSYEFASDDPSITLTVPRSLQSKSDEYVSVADFGAIGDGSTDNATFFQNAVNELFRNTNQKYRKVLRIPNGEYIFGSDVSIPSNAILQGETRDGAILNFGTNNLRLTTSNGTETALFSSSDRPENITFENFTFLRTTGQTILTGSKNTTLKNVKFQGTYQLGDTVTSISTEPSSVFWSNNVAGVTVNDLAFEYCLFQEVSVGVTCAQTITQSSTVKFDECKFYVNDTGMYINGISGQENNWNIVHCDFEEVAKQAFRSSNGTGTTIDSCRFTDCGNNTNLPSSPVSAIVYFGESTNNKVVNSSSDRYQNANIVSVENVAAITEVYNGEVSNFTDRVRSDIYLSDSFRPLSIFSAENRYFYINYTLRLSTHTRIGKLTLTLDDDFTTAILTDEYQYSAESAASSGGVLMTNFIFDAELKDNDSDSGTETVVLYYKNPLATGSTGSISFDIKYGV